MSKSRLKAFSDWVLAIITMIMALELKPIFAMNFGTSQMVIPTFLSYLVSFLFVAINWMNHHHLYQMVRAVDAKIFWYNMSLLFWLSLFP